MYGLSYATCFHNDIDKLKKYEGSYSLIEIPCFELDEVMQIIEICKRKNLKYGFHYPSFNSYYRVGYQCPGAMCSDILRYRLLADTAEYFLVHFPSDYTSIPLESTIEHSFSALCQTVYGFQCDVLVENLSKYPTFREPQQYLKLLQTSSIKLCLDIGHAHMIHEDTVYEFIHVLGEHISAVHYYNTSNDPQHLLYGKHVQPTSIYCKESSFMNLYLIKRLLLELPNLKYFVDESYHDISATSDI